MIIEIPSICSKELEYTLSVIFSEFFGLKWSTTEVRGGVFKVTLPEQPGGLLLPNVFFPLAEKHWLKPESLPAAELGKCDTTLLCAQVNCVAEKMPVLFGNPVPVISYENDNLFLSIDIFGSSFFMLSRYEEAVSTERDTHDRFPAIASLAFKAGFLERPIVDEYVELLWSAMNKLWPGIRNSEEKN